MHDVIYDFNIAIELLNIRYNISMYKIIYCSFTIN